MTLSDLEKLKFPIGKFVSITSISDEMIGKAIEDIEWFPKKLKKEVATLSNEQLDTRYRPDGWTIRQVVHHCADSHMNCFIRFKLALTEHYPTIKPYEEALWAEQSDYINAPVESSLNIIEGLHYRWVMLLKSLTHDQLEKSFIHPEYGTTYRLDDRILMYGWHCQHHLAHITELKKRMNWH